MTVSASTRTEFSVLELPRANSKPFFFLLLMARTYLLVWLGFSVLNGLRAALWFNGYPVNGPFQLFDPIRRLAAGQRAGIDFQFFHGIGIPFLHYPLFVLFGGHSLTASELSRQFTSLLLFLISLTFFAFVALRTGEREKSAPSQLWSRVTIGMASAILVLEALFPRSAEPGHSLISGRSTFPILAFAVLQLRCRLLTKAVIFGACVGCAFVFGTEHGISLTLTLLLFLAYSVVQSFAVRDAAALRENVRFAATSISVSILTGAALLIAFCGVTGAARAIHYNLSELPADQFWFFGSPPMPYLASLSQLLHDRHVLLCFFPSVVFAAFVVGILLRRYRKPLRLGSGNLDSAAVLMLTYGILTTIPLLAILSRHYVYPQTRILLLLGLLAVGSLLRKGSLFRSQVKVSRAAWMLSSVLFCSLLLLLARNVRSSLDFIQHERQQPVNAAHLDEHWDKFLSGATKVIDEHRTQPQVNLWSEYAALLDAHYGTFQPAEDYIIHAVGRERWAHYIAQFRQTNPEFVTTMTSQFSFAEWLQDERWQFYDALLNNYHPLGEVEHDTIWQRNAGPWVEGSQTLEPVSIPSSGKLQIRPGVSASISLPLQQPGDVIVVQVSYRVMNPWAKLPLLGGTPRFLISPLNTSRNMAVSLPPYEQAFSFPVKQTGANPVALEFRCDSFLPHASWQIEGIRIRVLPQSPATKELFAMRRIPSRY